MEAVLKSQFATPAFSPGGLPKIIYPGQAIYRGYYILEMTVTFLIRISYATLAARTMTLELMAEEEESHLHLHQSHLASYYPHHLKVMKVQVEESLP